MPVLNTFQHEPSRVVQAVLVALGLGTMPSAAQEWPIWAENEPDRPDNGITVQATKGRDDLRDMLDGSKTMTRGIQIRVRGNDRKTAWTRADLITAVIADRSLCYFDQPACQVDLEPVSGTAPARYVLQTFVRIGDPIPIGTDLPGGRRQVFTINCEARIVQQA